MSGIEKLHQDLKGVLPKSWMSEDSVLVDLLKIFNRIHENTEDDVLGRIYEYQESLKLKKVRMVKIIRLAQL